MALSVPKSTFGRNRSAFALINPESELYTHKIGRANHVAISYVWTDWTNGISFSTNSIQPDWSLLRERLREIVGHASSTSMKILTGNSKVCWLDLKCIDQQSPGDKAYWIPRMDEIYSEARCSVILLRGVDFTALVELEKQIACDVDDDRHNCLMTQSCVSLASVTLEQENASLEALEVLYHGTWRQRAWIFQEILLSQEYVLSGENGSQIKLSDAGLLANILFCQQENKPWLQGFADWCRRLAILRHRYFNYTLSPANVLQLAGNLHATYPGDRYYALCGVLRLKKLCYIQGHTEDQALHAVVQELTKRGTLSWLNAVSPSTFGGLEIRDRNLTSYLDHELQQIVLGSSSKTELTANSLLIEVMELGTVSTVTDLESFLQAAVHGMRGHQIEELSPYDPITTTPTIIQRIAPEIINPFLMEPLLGRVCKFLGIESTKSQTELVWKLYSFPIKTIKAESLEDSMTKNLLITGAWLLHKRIAKLQAELLVAWWHEPKAGKQRSNQYHSMNGQHIMIGSKFLKADDGVRVFVSREQPITFAAYVDESESGDIRANLRWLGSLYHLGENKNNVGATAFKGPTSSWKAKRNGWKKMILEFPIDVRGET